MLQHWQCTWGQQRGYKLGTICPKFHIQHLFVAFMYYRQKYNPFNSCLLGYDDRQSGQWLPLFQSNIRLRYHLTKLKVEAVGFFKMSVTIYQLHSAMSQKSTTLIFIEDYQHLGCKATQFVNYLLMFQRKLLHPSSGLESEKEGGNNFLQNTGKQLTDCMALQTTQQQPP